MTPASVFDRIVNPESRNTSSIAALSASAVASNLRIPFAEAMADSRSSSAEPTPRP